MSTLMRYLLSFRPRVTEKKERPKQKGHLLDITKDVGCDNGYECVRTHLEMKIKVAAANMKLR